jgi:large subunit ribosomal protein L9
MKVILFEEDRVVNVSDGYARNYLLPKGLAAMATEKALKQMEKRAAANADKREQEKKNAQELAEKLEANPLTIKADAGEEGKLFGSVTAADVALELKSTAGVEIDKRKINLNEHIKTLGEFSATLKLHRDVNAHLKIIVEKK